jgi:hypothetical protein
MSSNRYLEQGNKEKLEEIEILKGADKNTVRIRQSIKKNEKV